MEYIIILTPIVIGLILLALGLAGFSSEFKKQDKANVDFIEKLRNRKKHTDRALKSQ